MSKGVGGWVGGWESASELVEYIKLEGDNLSLILKKQMKSKVGRLSLASALCFWGWVGKHAEWRSGAPRGGLGGRARAQGNSELMAE